jgi:hypothetical protein
MKARARRNPDGATIRPVYETGGHEVMKDRARLICILERRGHTRLDATLEANPILPEIDALLGEHFLPLVIDDGTNLSLGTPKVNRTGDAVGRILVQDRTQVLREMLTGDHLTT